MTVKKATWIEKKMKNKPVKINENVLSNKFRQLKTIVSAKY